MYLTFVASVLTMGQIPKLKYELFGTQDTEDISRLCFTRDDRYLITSTNAGKVRVWDFAKRRILKTLEIHHDRSWFAPFVALSPDGTLMAVAHIWDGQHAVRVFRLSDWRESFTLLGHKRGVRCAAFSPDGRLLVTASGHPRGSEPDNRATDVPHELFVWDVASRQVVRRLTTGGSWVSDIVFSPDGKSMATHEPRTENSPYRASFLRVWNTSDWSVIRDIDDIDLPLYDIVYLPDSTELLMADKTRIWRCAVSGEGVRSPPKLIIDQPQIGQFFSVTLACEGRVIATTGLHSVLFFDLEGHLLTFALSEELTSICAVSHDGRHLVFCSGIPYCERIHLLDLGALCERISKAPVKSR
jgi:WD40 repeat protein